MIEDNGYKYSSPLLTIAALPNISTLPVASLTITLSSPPRLEHWRATKPLHPSFWAHQGPMTECADPVTGSCTDILLQNLASNTVFELMRGSLLLTKDATLPLWMHSGVDIQCKVMLLKLEDSLACKAHLMTCLTVEYCIIHIPVLNSWVVFMCLIPARVSCSNCSEIRNKQSSKCIGWRYLWNSRPGCKTSWQEVVLCICHHRCSVNMQTAIAKTKSCL